MTQPEMTMPDEAEANTGYDLRHYGSLHVTQFDFSAKYETNHRMLMKPNGLWVSVGTAWHDWCTQEEFREYDKYLAITADLSDVLHLATVQDLQEFHDEYAEPLYGLSEPIRALDSSRYRYPNWEKVAENYSGILIDPYQWSMRMDLDLTWYYAWDVASGCFWDLSIVKSVREVRL